MHILVKNGSNQAQRACQHGKSSWLVKAMPCVPLERVASMPFSSDPILQLVNFYHLLQERLLILIRYFPGCLRTSGFHPMKPGSWFNENDVMKCYDGGGDMDCIGYRMAMHLKDQARKLRAWTLLHQLGE